MKNEITQSIVKTPTEKPETIHGKQIYRSLTDIVETLTASPPSCQTLHYYQ